MLDCRSPRLDRALSNLPSSRRTPLLSWHQYFRWPRPPPAFLPSPALPGLHQSSANRGFQPAAALVNQSASGSPNTPFLAVLSPAPSAPATSPCSFCCQHPEPANLTGDNRSVLSPTPVPTTCPRPHLPLQITLRDATLARSETQTRKPQIRATQISRADLGGRSRRPARAGPANIARRNYRREAAGSCSL